ncbi:MAG: SUMF1/EgtB/PvdO family nonheme iron enzyme [Treponemataceae bacterium]
MFKKKSFLLFISLVFVFSCAEKEKPLSEAVGQSGSTVEDAKSNVAETDFAEIDFDKLWFPNQKAFAKEVLRLYKDKDAANLKKLIEPLKKTTPDGERSLETEEGEKYYTLGEILLAFYEEKNTEALLFFLENGATGFIETRAPIIESYLHYAIKDDDLETYHKLVKAGAKKDAYFGYANKFSDFFYAVSSKSYNFIEYFLKNGADPNENYHTVPVGDVERSIYNAVYLAGEDKKALDLLFKYGAKEGLVDTTIRPETENGEPITYYRKTFIKKTADGYEVYTEKTTVKEKPSDKILTCKEIKMVNIAGGTFKRPKKDGTEKEISVDSFKLSEMEITLGQFREFLSETGGVGFYSESDTGHCLKPDGTNEVWVLSQFEYEGKALQSDFKMPSNWAAPYISFFDACEFCNWLSKKNGLAPVYIIHKIDEKNLNNTKVSWDKSKNGYRLPTEAEWEYALGEVSANKLSEIANLTFKNIKKGSAPEIVASKKPNTHGIYDMLGNVYEWCWDLYDINYYETCEGKNPRGPEVGFNPDAFDPHNKGVPPSTTDRVIKGYDFFSVAKDDFEPFHRNFSNPAANINPVREICIGFRLAQNSDK